MFILATASLSFSLYAHSPALPKSLDIGAEVPLGTLEMQAVNGERTSLHKAQTKNGLLVMFSCNTCPYVIKSQDRTREMMDYATQRGIGMVIVNSNEAYRKEADAPTAMKAYAHKQGYRVPYLIDDKSRLADAFGATRTPEVFLFDSGGRLIYKGAMEDNPSNPSESSQFFLKQAIDAMLAGAPADPNSTKSIGCSIKRLQ